MTTSLLKSSDNLIQRLLLFFLASTLLFSCRQDLRDKGIKIAVAARAKGDINFAGVNFTVKNSVITLSGACPTPESHAAVKQSLQTVHVIKRIDDHIIIAPVLLGSSSAIKQAVDSVLVNYPLVTADVRDSVIVLKGMVHKAESVKLLQDIKKLDHKQAIVHIKVI